MDLIAFLVPSELVGHGEQHLQGRAGPHGGGLALVILAKTDWEGVGQFHPCSRDHRPES